LELSLKGLHIEKPSVKPAEIYIGMLYFNPEWVEWPLIKSGQAVRKFGVVDRFWKVQPLWGWVVYMLCCFPPAAPMAIQDSSPSDYINSFSRNPPLLHFLYT
jgi:hypothetical protein